MKLTTETVELMLRCWAEWTMTGQGKTPYDDTPRDAIYIGAEPVPDTPMLVEQCLAEMRQSEVGQYFTQFLEIHYCHFNRPTYVKLNLMKAKLHRGIRKDEFYDNARVARIIAHYEMQQIDDRGMRTHKALRKKRKASEN